MIAPASLDKNSGKLILKSVYSSKLLDSKKSKPCGSNGNSS